MEYLTEIEKLIRESGVYQEFLRNMPVPLNNVYFDMVVAGVLVVYLIYRIGDGIRMIFRRKKLMRMREAAMLRSEEERQLREQEAELQKSKLAAFLQFIQGQGGSQGSWRDSREQRDKMFKSIGTNRLRIGSTHSASDFEILMKEAKQSEAEE